MIILLCKKFIYIERIDFNMDKKDLKLHLPRWNELPNIDLYIDQVVTLINSTLSPFLTNVNMEDVNLLLTKNMINNYVKNKIIEPPIKKKYNKNHLSKFFVICVLKEVYKINDIKILIELALQSSNIENAYDNFCKLFEESLECVFKKVDFIDKFSTNDNKYLLKSVLLSCAYAIYTKKQI